MANGVIARLWELATAPPPMNVYVVEWLSMLAEEQAVNQIARATQAREIRELHEACAAMEVALAALDKALT